ncbi:MAG: ABC transporter substrate-binding protein [Haloplanus sp.]
MSHEGAGFGTSRRRLLGMLGTAGGASLAGCFGDGSGGGDDETELVATLAADVRNYDPTQASDTTSNKVFDLVYEPLLSVDFAGNVRSVLATNVERTDGDRQWRISLREGVTFHDGSDLTAADVKATFERYEGTPRESDVFLWYDDSTVRDDHTLDLTLSERYGPLKVSLGGVPIVPEAAATDELDLSETPVGTGPFAFDSHEPDQLFRLTSAENYWYDGDGDAPATPPVDTLTFRIIVEGSSQVAALRAGDVDLANNPPAGSVADLKSDDEFTVTEHLGGGYEMLVFPLATDPFSNRKVRRGVARLVPREDVVDSVYAGIGRPAHAPISPLLSSYTSESFQREMKSKYTGYDPDRARELLRDGFEAVGTEPPYETAIVTNENPERVRWAQLVRDSLNETEFFDVTVQQFEWNTYVGRVLAGDSNEDDAMMALGWTGGWDPDIYLRNVFYSEQATPSCCNISHYSNPKVDRLLDEGLTTYDESKRREIYREAQRRVVADAPAAFVRYSHRMEAFSSDVEGFRTYPLDSSEFTALYAPWADTYTAMGREG